MDKSNVRIQVTPELSSALHDLLWSWMLNHEFEYESYYVAKIVAEVEDKARFVVGIDGGLAAHSQGHRPCS